MARLCCLTQLGMLLMGVCKVIISPGGVEVSFTWSDRYGEFATTYRPRAVSGESNIVRGGNGGNCDEERHVNLQSANDALKTALKSLGKNEDDEIVAKIFGVYAEIADKPSATLSAIAQTLGLSERTVDEYVSILKGIGVLRRKDGKKFGTWEILA